MDPLKPVPSPTYQVTLSPADCALDLGDGSERGEYVSQDYILTTLGRPHRAVNLMYCYYPFDKGWPQRASVAHKPKGDHAWPFPYDDYFPYPGGPKGDAEGEAFRQMRDIRRHGQEVTLTLTVDCAVPDGHLRILARQLRPYGFLRLRLNHECDGNWFAFNRRYSYGQVAAFFIRFAGVLKKEAPNVRIMGCWGHVTDFKTGALRYERELAPMLPVSDIWSADQYISLHYGWPYKGCDPGDLDKTYKDLGVDHVWRQLEGVHRRFVRMSGQDKGLEVGEFNADGDVGGEVRQSKLTEAFYRRVLREKPKFLKGVTYYQFRDRGRLGLEREDPNHEDHGVPTPFLPVYREFLQDPYFQPKEKWSRQGETLKADWRSADDSDGLGWQIPLKGRPLFLELLFEKEANLMIKAGKRWFYKKPGVEWVDVTHAASPWGKARPFPVAVFAPPADGMNPGGASHVPARLHRPPQIRLYYQWKPQKKAVRR